MPSHYTLNERPHSSHSRVLSLFAEHGAGKTVLDLGCGNAYLGGLLARRGYRVTGVERPDGYDPEVIPPGVTMVERDLEQPLGIAETFDYVLCADVLEHLREPERLLRECARRLRPGGALIASLPNSGHLYFRLQVLCGRFPRHDKGLFDRTHLRFFMWDGWRGLLADAGFTPERTEVSGVPFAVAFPGHAGAAWVRAGEWASHLTARIWKKLFAYQFIVRCYHRVR